MRTYAEETTGFDVLEFRDAYELLEYSQAPIPNIENHQRYSFVSNDFKQTKWMGTKTYTEAANLITTGYKTAIREISDRQKKIKKLPRGKEFIFAEYGDFFDVGEVLSGSPEPWLTEVPSKNLPTVYDIIINATVFNGVTSNELYNFGAAILSLIDSLATGNNIVNIKFCFMVSGLTKSENSERKNLKIIFSLCTKPIDTDLMGYVLCHTSFMRRIILGCMEKFMQSPNLNHCSYGDLEEIDQNTLGENQFYISPIRSYNKNLFSTPESAWNYIKNIAGIEDN